MRWAYYLHILNCICIQYFFVMEVQVSRMVSVKYVAPLKRLDACGAQSCHLDPYTMLSPRQSSMLYVVEVEQDNQLQGLMEGDQLIVDEKRIPRRGDTGIYGTDSALYACQIFENNGTLNPIGHEKLSREHRVVFGGIVTRLIRYYS